MTERRKAYQVLTMNTLAFTVCFAVWMMYGVLITYLVSQRVYDFDKAQMGWLIGTPVLTGAIFRLPVGVLTDKYGGRIVFALVMLIAAVGAYLTSYADSFWGFIATGLLFGPRRPSGCPSGQCANRHGPRGLLTCRRRCRALGPCKCEPLRPRRCAARR